MTFEVWFAAAAAVVVVVLAVLLGVVIGWVIRDSRTWLGGRL